MAADTTLTELVVVSAESDEALVAEARRIAAFLERVSDVSLVDVAYTCSRTHGPSRLAVVASSSGELRSRLTAAATRIASGAARIRDKSGTYYERERLLAGDSGAKLAFVYPGVPSFYPDMLRDVVVAFPECRSAFDELEEALKTEKDFRPSDFIFPPAPYYQHDADVFSSGAYAQALVSVFTASDALSRLVKRVGIAPDGVVGCAGGDLAAAMASGSAPVSSRADRVRAVRDIYKVVYKAVNHGGLPKTSMVSVMMRQEGEADGVVAGFPRGKAALAIEFSPRRRVYAIEPDFEEQAAAAFAAAGIRTMRMALDRPFNTAKCESIVPAIRHFADSLLTREATVDVYSCGIQAPLPKRLRTVRSETAERWAKSVRFAETVRRMHDDGYRVFLEVGPRGLMTDAVEDTLKGREFAAIALNSVHRRGMLQLQHALARLAALGANADFSPLYDGRRARAIDFSQAVSLEVRRDAEMRLSRAFPRMTLLGTDHALTGAEYLSEPKTRNEKLSQRRAALERIASRSRQFDRGAIQPLISDADEISSVPGISCEICKVFTTSAEPFLADFSIGSSQISYSDPNLKGLLLLPVAVGIEVMAEAAMRVMPSRALAAVEDFSCRRRVAFRDGRLRLFIRAERIASGTAGTAALRVLIRDDSPNSEYTWAIMEATVILSSEPPAPMPGSPMPLTRPRSVHWSGREIYPAMLSCGSRLRGIAFVRAWGEGGLDYTVRVPQRIGAVAAATYPLWAVNPILLEIVASGFRLWRSQDRFPGSFSLPLRLRRIEILGAAPKEGAELNCYLRLTGVTPESQLCDITVTGGDGNTVFEISGWEEQTSRVPKEYCQMLLQPANAFLSSRLSREIVGNPGTDIATAYTTDVPYHVFERSEALWLKLMGRLVLSDSERRKLDTMTGSVARRTEWLFGRLVAKEAVRRFLKDFYQARWSDADVQICPDPNGKPVAIGEWRRYLTTKLDIAIAHTAQFVVAVAAANARVGVDVESATRDLSEEFTRGVFTDEELELAANSTNSAQAFLRFWCAKEAVSKALGTGIRYSPRELVISGYQPETGQIFARLEGAWVDAFKSFKGRDIVVSSRIMQSHALAFCFIPASMFE